MCYTRVGEYIPSMEEMDESRWLYFRWPNRMTFTWCLAFFILLTSSVCILCLLLHVFLLMLQKTFYHSLFSCKFCYMWIGKNTIVILHDVLSSNWKECRNSQATISVLGANSFFENQIAFIIVSQNPLQLYIIWPLPNWAILLNPGEGWGFFYIFAWRIYP